MNSEVSPQAVVASAIRHELSHMRDKWFWFFLLGILLVAGGTLAISYPFVTSASVAIILGAILMVEGIATVVGAFWAGKWSAFLLHVLVGVLYVVAGFTITESPLESVAIMTLFIAAFLVVLGIFRIVAALTVRFPQWGWALLNGVVTLLAGLIIFRLYRNCPANAFWIIGLLVGLELLFNGWTWIMMALAIRNLPKEA
jgi:uncharacterized membrane protein HdeD (DUF308 family)